MKKIFLGFFFLFLSNILLAQSIITSDVEDFDASKNSIEFIAKRFNYYYFAKTIGSIKEINVYDTLLKKVATAKLDFFDASSTPFDILTNRDGFNVFFSESEKSRNKKEDLTFLKMATLNDYVKLLKRPKNIDTLDNGYFLKNFYHSKNNLFLVAWFTERKNKNNEQNHIIKIFNESGELLKKVRFTNDKFNSSLELIVNNQGDLFWAYPQIENKIYSVYSLPFLEREIKKEDITDIPIKVNRLFLRESETPNSVSYILDISKNNPLDKTVNRGFAFGTLNAYSSPTFQSTMNSNLTLLDKVFSKNGNYKVRYLNTLENGGFLMALEEYNETTETIIVGSGFTRGGSFTRTQTIYEFGNIHVLAIDNNGNLMFETEIEKYQKSVDDNGIGSSFGVINSGSSLSVFYNSIEDGVNRILKGYKIFPTGEKKDLFFIWKNAIKDVTFLAGASTQIGKTEDILPIIKKNQIGIAKINL